MEGRGENVPPQGQERKFPGRNPQVIFSKARNPPCFQGGSELAYKKYPQKKPPLCRSRAGDHTSASSQFNGEGTNLFFFHAGMPRAQQISLDTDATAGKAVLWVRDTGEQQPGAGVPGKRAEPGL